MNNFQEMMGLTLTQPYASFVALLEKELETRSWGTSYRGAIAIHASKNFQKWARDLCVTEPFASVLIRHNFARLFGYITLSLDLNAIPLGKIVAVCELTAVHKIPAQPQTFPRVDAHFKEVYPTHALARSTDVLTIPPRDGFPRPNTFESSLGWFETGRYAWVLSDVCALPEPIECKGSQRLWHVPAPIVAQIRAQ